MNPKTIQRAYLECIADLADAVGQLAVAGIYCADLEARVIEHLNTYEELK